MTVTELKVKYLLGIQIWKININVKLAFEASIQQKRNEIDARHKKHIHTRAQIWKYSSDSSKILCKKLSGNITQLEQNINPYDKLHERYKTAIQISKSWIIKPEERPWDE